MVLRPLNELVRASAHNRGMTLCLALSYGGREMIAKAARELAASGRSRRGDPEDVDVELLGSYLPSSTLLPQLDLLIRTSGERRVSNFFLVEVAYAQLYFSPVMWPDFGESDLSTALREYGKRERRFGLTSEQIAGVGPQHSPPSSRMASSLEALESLGDPLPEPG